MNSTIRLVAVVAGFVFVVPVTPSWAGPAPTPTCDAPGCNPTVSDANDNTAGGNGRAEERDELAKQGIRNRGSYD